MITTQEDTAILLSFVNSLGPDVYSQTELIISKLSITSGERRIRLSRGGGFCYVVSLTTFASDYMPFLTRLSYFANKYDHRQAKQGTLVRIQGGCVMMYNSRT